MIINFLIIIQVSMDFQYEVKGASLTIYVPRELDHHVASQIQARADLAVDTYRIQTVIFDFSETEFMDSSGIGVILGRCRNMGFAGGKVKAVHLKNERVRKIFSMAGLYKLVKVEEDQDE